MLTGTAATRVFVCTEPQDLRRGFDGLSGLVVDRFGASPFSGHWFAFFNRKGDRCKVLAWDRGGFWLLYRRIERGRFPVRWSQEDGGVEVDPAELWAVLAGLDLRHARKVKRWQPGGEAAPPIT